MRKLLIILLLFISCSKAPSPFQPSSETIAQMDATASGLYDISDVRGFVGRFIPITGETSKKPSIELVFENGFIGNCNTVAVMAHWATEIIGYDAIIVDLFGSTPPGHTICIAWNQSGKWHLFTSKASRFNTYAYFESADWRIPALEYFGNRYSKIVVTGLTHDQGRVE